MSYSEAPRRRTRLSSLLLSTNHLVLLLSTKEEFEALLLLCTNGLWILFCAMFFDTKLSILLVDVYSPRRRMGSSSSSILNVFVILSNRLVLLVSAR